MTHENNQKIKLLRIMDLLRHETDEEHPLKTSEICARLLEMHITCDTRTLGKDMRFLNDQGYEVLYRMIGHEKAYYLEDRSFSVPELKILLDAVQAASFITEKKTAELTEKIADLAGSNRADLLTQNLIRFNANKHSNETIYYTVERLEQAVYARKKVSFLYFDLNEKHEKVYRNNRQRYVREPVALVYYEDNYYLVCYSALFKRLYSFRVDRMTEVEIEEEPVSAEARKYIDSDDISAFTEETFKMYGGDAKPVKLEFSDELIDVIYDKFGEDTVMSVVGEHVMEALVKVQISPMFFGWVCQFAGKMRIAWPESVQNEFTGYILNVNRIVPETETED